jgi:hypothetical protein
MEDGIHHRHLAPTPSPRLHNAKYPGTHLVKTSFKLLNPFFQKSQLHLLEDRHLSPYPLPRIAQILGSTFVMIAFPILLALTAIARVGLTSPVLSGLDYALKESHNVPPRWSQVGEPHPLQPLKLNIGLKPNNVDLLKQHLHEGRSLPKLTPHRIQHLILSSFKSRSPSLWPTSVCTASSELHATDR